MPELLILSLNLANTKKGGHFLHFRDLEIFIYSILSKRNAFYSIQWEKNRGEIYLSHGN